MAGQQWRDGGGMSDTMSGTVNGTEDTVGGAEGGTEGTPERHPREPHDRQPALKGWPVGVWCPDAVGKVRGYPRTQETFNRQRARLRANSEGARAAGTLVRTGVPNGFAGRKAEIPAIRRNSRTAAERLVEAECGCRVPTGRPVREDYPTQQAWEDALAAVALAVAAEIAMSPLSTGRERTAASRLFLEFTMPRPAVKQALSLEGGGPEFLRKLAAHVATERQSDDDDGRAEAGTPGDTSE